MSPKPVTLREALTETHGDARLDLVAIIISRLLMFAALYGVTRSLDAAPALRFLTHAYGWVTVVFLALVGWYARRGGMRSQKALFLLLMVEVPLETAIVWQGGGYLSDYALLYILTILVGGLFLSVAGVFALTSLVACLFGLIGLVQMGMFPALEHALPEAPIDWIQVRFFLFTTLFYAVALLATQGARRLAEVRRRLEGTERALDLQEYRFAHILHELPSGVLFFDAAFNLQYWNPVVEEWFKLAFRKGLPLEEALEGVLDLESLQAMRLEGPLFPFTELDVMAPDARPLHVQYKPLLKAGHFQGSVFILLDFTLETKWKETLVHQERLAALGRLAAGIAHEIRNPLASISGSAQMLEEWPGFPDSERKLLQLITQESRRLNHLLTDLLGYVRERRVQRRPVTVKMLFADVQLSLQSHPSFDAKKVTLATHLPKDDLTFESDADLLHRVLLNLGLNAVEALEGMPGKVEFQGMQVGDEIRLTVTDTGPGLPEEVLVRAFEPFFTTKPQGTGLGLATCQQDVQILGGSINLSSPTGSGAVVTIRFPLVAEAGESDKHGNPAARSRKVAHS
jgi:two-component system, NtrC family, sensor histidine kinase PilS